MCVFLSLIVILLLFSYFITLKEIKRLKLDFYIDELTKMKNKRYLKEKIEKYYSHYDLVIADIDYFKKINDTYGHLTGDHILRYFSKALLTELRIKPTHLVRYGGEEFILFYDKNKYNEDQIFDSIDEFRDDLSKKQIQLEVDLIEGEAKNKFKDSMPTINITSSFGLCCSDTENLEEKIAIADNNLYIAKKDRNKVVR